MLPPMNVKRVSFFSVPCVLLLAAVLGQEWFKGGKIAAQLPIFTDLPASSMNEPLLYQFPSTTPEVGIVPFLLLEVVLYGQLIPCGRTQAMP